MKKFVLFAVVLGLSALLGCAAPTPTPAPQKSGTFRVGFTSAADVGDVPTLMAHDALRAQGYTVVATFFAGADLEVAALAHGDLDMGNGSTRTHWSADAKDAGILTLMEEASDDWSIVAENAIQSCADLDGKRIAYSSSGALNAALLKAYLEQNCPTAKPQILLIPNSPDRASALLSGNLDATPLELVDLMDVQKQAGDKFHTLVNFAQAIPQVKTTGVHVRSAFAQQHPDMVRDYVKAVLEANRQVQANPKLGADAAVKYLKLDPAEAQTAVQAYVDNKIWDANGGMTKDAVTFSVDFFTKTGSLPAGLTADKVADLSYLDAVLNEIGRK